MFVFGLIKRLPTGGGFISNKLSSGYIARYSTNVDFFFNRKRELARFRDAFQGTPKLHVILGPPSTGKTALVRQITTKDKLFHPFFIDCRAGQFDTPTNVYNSIKSAFKPFFQFHKDLLEKILGLRFKLVYEKLEAELQLGSNNREITSFNVRELLVSIRNCLPLWSIWRGYDIPAPILIIDEANMFNQLGNSDPDFLHSVLSWMVLNTKQEKRFHIVLTSSDSFFFNWLESELHIPHATPYVVGDLSKEEAEEYFEKHILPQYGCKELEGKFDQVRRITGTRMIIIDMYVDEYKRSGGKLATDENFSVIGSEYIRLKNGLDPEILKVKDKQPPLWEADDLVKTMDALVKAEDQGYILEEDLRKTIGSSKVVSLIKYNFLHRRPTSLYAFDIDAPKRKPVLTAMNQPSVCAMKEILAEK